MVSLGRLFSVHPVNQPIHTAEVGIGRFYVLQTTAFQYLCCRKQKHFLLGKTLNRWILNGRLLDLGLDTG
ncbi:MAG TPA: hypothetical protein DCF33_11015 [Saprospirales bacterium]|nr:hypothetical protein [Saprospirales bacterium]